MRDLLKCKIQERINTSNAIMGVFIDGNGKISEEVMFIFDSLKKQDKDINTFPIESDWIN